MKKVTTILILLLISAFMLTGCAKCIDKKEESVKVKIVNEYYKPEEQRITTMSGKIRIYTSHAVYAITVDYDGIEYSLTDEDTYRKYHGRIGETVQATLCTKTYDNDEVKRYIIRLGGL